MKKLAIAEFFNREYDGPRVRIFFMSLVGSLSLTLLVAIVNESAEAIAYSGDVEVRLFLLFLATWAISMTCKHYTLTQITRISERLVRKVRVRLVDKLRHTELQFLERTEKGDIYARISHDTDFISLSSTEIMHVFEASVASIFLYIYVAVISPVGFVFTMSFIMVLFLVLFLNYRKIRDGLNSARLKEADFFDGLNDTLSGFKEIKINSKKNNALFADIETLSREAEHLKTDAGIKNNNNTVLAFFMYEGLLAVVIFAVPIFSDIHTQSVIKLVAAMTFVMGMLDRLTRSMPAIISTNVAAENLERLEASIDSFGALTATVPTHIPTNFREIALNSVFFQYTGKQGETLFTLEPVNLTIQQGEILFIVGGNGSGKSTLLKLLTGLYYPLADGCIALDGQTVVPENYQTYRELFSIIFTDFHMFRKLYGVKSVDEQQVKHLLKEMDIHRKTDYVDGIFTNLDLSTGQKKRLAYIAALLEDKPVYIFDEWAADQDPMFRKHFYERFLEDLRAMGKTIIAATHDDKYFDKADRILKMEEGKMTEINL